MAVLHGLDEKTRRSKKEHIVSKRRKCLQPVLNAIHVAICTGLS